MVLSIMQQQEVINLLNTFGLPLTIAGVLAWFLFRHVWPWMTATMERYVEENRQNAEKYAAQVDAIRADTRDRDAALRAELSRIENDYRSLSLRMEAEYKVLMKSQAELTVKVVEAVSSITIAMQTLSAAVDKIREAAALEDRVSELERSKDGGAK